jgi:hypothetical protein
LNAVVFLGPSLRLEEARARLSDAVYLPPVSIGDVYRVVRARPRAIGIIDGYFEGVPAVWHKEILFAMAEGVHVFGSASMGALRAAELHAFGMQGVGRIFEDYRRGVLEDDDEVAVLHGPTEADFVALSEPMVNVRATLARAEREGIITAEARTMLVATAKAMFYQERSWEAVLAAADGALPGDVQALQGWLPRARVDQKRLDALAMLAAMHALLADDPEPRSVSYSFEWTDAWDQLTTSVGTPPPAADAKWARAGASIEQVLEEAGLEEARTRAGAREGALLRALARRECDRRRRASPAAVRAAITRLRTDQGLLTHDALERWLDVRGLDARAFERLMEDEARIFKLFCLLEPGLAPHHLDRLRLRGDYEQLAERARRKQAAVAALGLDDPEPEDLGLTPAQLRSWYFERQLGRAIPDDLDAFARATGFATRAELDRALLREYALCAGAVAPSETGP